MHCDDSDKTFAFISTIERLLFFIRDNRVKLFSFLFMLYVYIQEMRSNER